jgi:glycosyltransferase involved in cell wall biosynthesis
MKFLIIESYFHHKNKMGLIAILNYLQWTYKVGKLNDIVNFDIIYSPSEAIDVSKYPTKKFIFGPHFSVFPDHKMNLINNKYANSIYIQPSKWAADVWINMGVKHIPIKSMPFAVNTNLFSPPKENNKNLVFIYFKGRKLDELNFLKKILKDKNIEYRIFDYRNKYQESDYLDYLKKSKYGIWLGRHESQGFALQEALSTNVPLLVWDVKSMNQEEGYNYPEIFGTAIPYWNNQCGEFFYSKEEFEPTYIEFINKLNTYEPRQFILENISVEKCAEYLKQKTS